MKFSRTTLATLAIMSTLVLSGISIPLVSAASNVTANVTFNFTPSAPTFVGSASAFLSGPTLVEPSTSVSTAAVTSTNLHHAAMPNLNSKPNRGADPSPLSNVPPKVNCLSGVSGCDSISLTSAASTNGNAVNAYDNLLNSQSLGALYGTVEPPDQGLCAGNGYVVEPLNQGEVQVFNSALSPVSGVIPLDSLMGLTAKGWSSGGDIMCQYDYANGGHWFITQFVSTTPEAAGGPFAGCFVGLLDGCREGIAVSVTNNPMGAYYVYFLDPNKVNSDPGAGYLLNDYAKTATTRDALQLFYDEYSLLTGALNGVQQYAFDKNALENGHVKVNVAYENMGTNANLAIPANGAFQPSPLPPSAWYQVIPAQTTDPSQYDNSNGGTGFMVASLDFLGFGDNRVATFDWTGLSALNSVGCSKCSSIEFGGSLLTGHVTYQDEGAPCLASNYATVSTFCGLGAQKVGLIPLGSNCVAYGLATGVISCPESGIASNGDGATQAFYSNGDLWTAVSTVVNQTFGKTTFEYHLGATYWDIEANNMNSGVHFGFAAQGVVTAAHEDMEFPSVAATPSSVLMSFTLSGNGGPTGADSGGFYPSSAYLMLGASNVIHVSALGASPQDGFTEYQGYSVTGADLTTRPRWGDYGQVVYDPGTGKFFFATEYIQHPNCDLTAFGKDPTCGGTRDTNANWGTSINSLSP